MPRTVTLERGPKTVTLRQVGWVVTGTAHVTLWMGGEGQIKMDETFIPLGQMTKENLHRAINDGRFGVRSIDHALLCISVAYEDGYRRFDRQVGIKNPNPDLVCRGI